MILVLAVTAIGAAVGGSVAAFTGGEAASTAVLGLAGAGQQEAGQTQGPGGGLPATAEEAAGTPAPDSDGTPAEPTGPSGFGGGGGTLVAGTLDAAGPVSITITTPEGPAEVAVTDESPVTFTTTVGEADDLLLSGAQITIVSAQAEDGSLSVGSVIVGTGGAPGGRGGALGGRGGGAFGAALNTINGTLVSFGGGVATITTESGEVEVPLGAEVPVQASTTFADAASVLTIGETVSALAQIADDGSLSAITVIVGQPGLGGFGGGRQRTGGFGGQAPAP